jgi:hypothetical protein
MLLRRRTLLDIPMLARLIVGRVQDWLGDFAVGHLVGVSDLLLVARALACGVSDKQPPVIIGPRLETALDRVLSDVFDFLLQLGLISYDVIEAFVHPDRAIGFKNLIYLSSGSTLNPLKDLTELASINEPEDCVRVIRHHDGGVQVDARLVAGPDGLHDEITSLGWKRDPRVTAKGYEVSSFGHFKVRQIAVPEDAVFKLPGIDCLKVMRTHVWRFFPAHEILESQAKACATLENAICIGWHRL